LSSAEALDIKKAETAGGEDLDPPPSALGLRISDIVKRKRIRSKAGWGGT